MSSIPSLTAGTSAQWKDKVMITLGCMDIAIAIQDDGPPKPTDTSPDKDVERCKKWDEANWLPLMIIKDSIPLDLHGTIPSKDKAKDYLKAIEEHFKRSSKALFSSLLCEFISLRHDGTGGVREYITKMRDMVTKLNDLKLNISDSFLVHYAINTCQTNLKPFKCSYITRKDEWTIGELVAMCEEESMHKKNKVESAHLAI